MRSGAMFTRMKVAGVEQATQVQVISETPCLYFIDTTTGDDDWRVCVDGDDWLLQQWVNDTTWTDRFRYDSSAGSGILTGSFFEMGRDPLRYHLMSV